MFQIGFIGSGNMATAISKGVVEGKLVSPEQIMMCDCNPEKLKSFAEQGYGTTQSIGELVQSCHYVVLAVKPQMFEGMLAQVKPHATEDKVFLSIAAGITGDYIRSMLGYPCKLVLVMPNTPILVGHGSTALSRDSSVTEEEFSFVQQLFGASGYVDMVPADRLNEVIPLNGSSPAFIYRFAQLFVEEGVKCGFDPQTANAFFCHALIGSAKMMLESGKTHQELIDMVTSPGGTTLKGLEALEEHHLKDAVQDCVQRTIHRAYELSQ